MVSVYHIMAHINVLQQRPLSKWPSETKHFGVNEGSNTGLIVLCVYFTELCVDCTLLHEILNLSYNERKNMYVSRTYSCYPDINISVALASCAQGHVWPSGIVVACMSICVYLFVCQPRDYPCHHPSPFPARATKSDKRCKTSQLRSILFKGLFVRNLQDKINSKGGTHLHFGRRRHSPPVYLLLGDVYWSRQLGYFGVERHSYYGLWCFVLYVWMLLTSCYWIYHYAIRVLARDYFESQ